MSKKIFSPQDWENVSSNTNLESRSMQTSSIIKSPSDLMNDVEQLVQKIEASGVDIAPEYNTWVNLGFALTDGFGDNGREFFHRLSRLHFDYDYTATDKQYTNCLNGRGTGITIASFFHYAAEAGIDLSPPSNTILPNTQNGKAAKWIKPMNELPHFPETVFEVLPMFLHKIVSNAISAEDRDVILIGTVGTLSVCFNNVCGVYDEREVYSNLYLFVVADAGMGKGALTLCRELVAPINQCLREQSAQMLMDYKRELAEYQKAKGKNPDALEPKPPPQKTLVIPANSSASSFLSILADNDGIGLLLETEGDTLSQTLKTEHGNYSDILRKGFHHEKVGMSRRKDHEFS